MKILGVTGQIGSGKSSVARILKERGASLIDADLIARQVQEKGQEAYMEMVEYFGHEILLEDGNLDRKKISDLVFNDKNKLITLNAIVHKHVAKKIKDQVGEAKGKFIVLDVPIPVEEGFFDTVSRVWTVTANADIRLVRIMNRMGISQEEALMRMGAQMSNSEYEEIADALIVNEGTFEDLVKLVDFELKRFLEDL